MLTLFPRIKPNPPAPPPSAPAAKDIQASRPDRTLATSVETPAVAAIPEAVAVKPTITAGQTVVATAAAATAETADAAAAGASGTQVLLATRESISTDVVVRGHGSIDSQLISVFTEAFVASTSSGGAAQKAASKPFIVEITCVPTAFDVTEAPLAPAQAEIAVAEPEPRLSQAEPVAVESGAVESAAVESVAAPAAVEPIVRAEGFGSNDSATEGPAPDAILPPEVAQSNHPEETVLPETANATASAATSASEATPVNLAIASTTIFDELDILHEVAETNAALAATPEEPEKSIAEPRIALDAVIEATRLTTEGDQGQAVAEALAASAAPQTQADAILPEALASVSEPVPEPIADSIVEPVGVAAETPIASSQIEQAEPQREPMALDACATPEAAAQPDLAAELAITVHVADVAAHTYEPPEEVAARTETPANSEVSSASEPNSVAEPEVVASSSETVAPEALGTVAEWVSAEAALSEACEGATSKAGATLTPEATAKPVASPRAIALPRKPPRSKASFFELQRIPEPEAMEDSEEVEAYSSATAQAHLDAIDDTFVAHAQLLVNGRERGRALDIGTGPGQIVIKLGARLTRWKFVGIDRSVAMIEKAREGFAGAPEMAGRIEFRIADGNSLDFPVGTFDLVICNSVLHHMAEPQKLFAEIGRVVKPGGAILLRDLVRPPRFSYGSHIRKNAKHYQGEMKRLYVASVQAAYTEEELQKMVAASPLRGVRIFRHAKTHIGFERPLARLF